MVALLDYQLFALAGTWIAILEVLLPHFLDRPPISVSLALPIVAREAVHFQPDRSAQNWAKSLVNVLERTCELDQRVVAEPANA